MLEFLGISKKGKIEGENSTEPSVGGVAHFDGNEQSLSANDETIDNLELAHDEDIDVEGVRISMDKNNTPEDVRSMRNVSNERRKVKIGEKHSDWKEKEPFALDLPEEEEKKSPLDLMAEEDQDNDEDNFEEKHREAA
jgi:hypothetical protein